MTDGQFNIPIRIMLADEDTQIYKGNMMVTIEEARALLQECKNSYISYENPVARELISRLVRFVDEYDRRYEHNE